ncbi:MAG: NUDIX domain-containing protein [Chloroflexi bacterium]|nr:NUDIX domain-containing protein [Chloroflexota bacterium]
MAAVQAGGIIVWRERVVLRRTANGEWVFPKGWIDPGETPEQAALREVREETGIQAEAIRYIGESSYEMDGEERPVAYYLMQAVGTPEWPEHGGLDAGAFLVSEVDRRLTFENNRRLWAEVAGEVARLARANTEPAF